MIHKIRAASVPWTDLVMSALLGLLLIGGLLGGVFVYHSLRTFVARSQLPIFPAATTTLPSELPTLQSPPAPEGSEPLPESGGVAPRPRESNVPPPVATERLTVLIMGIDRRETEEGPWRTDTMIVVSIDPKTESVAMLSVPRDLFVTIPDYGQGEHLDRINKAFFFGDSENYPGGGPALARQTIRRNFGIEVDRYIVMDFDGFRRIIDHIGGIEITVPELLVDNEYPTEDYGYMRVRFEPGRQHMDGERALIYSRTRKSTSDFARAARQQEVILAVRDRVLSMDIIPSLTPANLAGLVTTLDDSLQTDMTLEEVIAFAQVARDIETKNIHRVVVDSTLVNDHITEFGAQVLLPRWAQILPLVEETFEMELLAIAPTPRIPSTVVPATPTTRPAEQRAPSARIEIRNGTTTQGLESIAATALQQRGFYITATGLADSVDYRQTTILLYNPSMMQVAESLRRQYLASANIFQMESGGSGTPDIVVILGTDVVDSMAGGGAP